MFVFVDLDISINSTLCVGISLIKNFNMWDCHLERQLHCFFFFWWTVHFLSFVLHAQIFVAINIIEISVMN